MIIPFTSNVTTTINVDTDDLITVLRLVGFPDAALDTAQAVAQAESGAYEDAVGDISLVTPKWGPSVGLFQVRSLHNPAMFAANDTWRDAGGLRNRFFNAEAALVISNNGADWSPWTTFNNGAYKQYLGQKPVIKTGHARAADWWR